VLNTSLGAVAHDLGFQADSGGAVVVSGCLLGAIAGALTAGQVADRWGPGRALLVNNAYFLAGSLLCAAAPGAFWGLLLGDLPVCLSHCLPL
jgi:MFS family permease